MIKFPIGYSLLVDTVSPDSKSGHHSQVQTPGLDYKSELQTPNLDSLLQVWTTDSEQGRIYKGASPAGAPCSGGPLKSKNKEKT